MLEKRERVMRSDFPNWARTLLAVAAIEMLYPVHSKGDLAQEQLKSDYLLAVSKMVHLSKTKQWMFHDWMCVGDMAKFRARLNQPSVKIKIDPSIDAAAQYDPRTETITLCQTPGSFAIAYDSSPGSSCLLWHEAIHAISHGHEIGAIQPSCPFQSVPSDIASTPDGRLKVKNSDDQIVSMGSIERFLPSGQAKALATANEAIDHLYINWAECCLASTQYLVQIEKYLSSHGRNLPPAEVTNKTQVWWRKFVEGCNSSFLQDVANREEREELERMIGFRCDPAEILSGYLSLGYPLEYFGGFAIDEQIWSIFPSGEQIGMQGVQCSKAKNPLSGLSVTYIMTWKDGPPGRCCSIHLTLYGSQEIAQEMWKGIRQTMRYEPILIPRVGNEAFLVKHSENSTGDYAIALVQNAHILVTDQVIDIEPVQITTRPIDWNIVKRMFLKILDMPVPLIPCGVECSIQKLKATSNP